MAKCVFCGCDCVKHSDEKVKIIGTKLQNSKNSLLEVFYQHVFLHCPKCKMVELNLDEREVEILRQNKQKILDVINNKELETIDENYFIRQAEAKGYACELLKDNAGAFLGYKACADLLALYIDDFIENMTSNVLHKDNKSYRIINRQNLNVFEYAKNHKDIMNKLVVGKYDENTIIELGYLGMLINIDTLLDITDSMIEKDVRASEVALGFGRSMIDNFKDVKFGDELEPAFERIKNRYLLLEKTINETK